MITAQWKELQKQIRRQHGWILSALDTIKADILQTDEMPEIMSEPQVRQSAREELKLTSSQAGSNYSYEVISLSRCDLLAIFWYAYNFYIISKHTQFYVFYYCLILYMFTKGFHNGLFFLHELKLGRLTLLPYLFISCSITWAKAILVPLFSVHKPTSLCC